MVSFMVMVQHENGRMEGLGSKKFAVAPRTGEYITVEPEFDDTMDEDDLLNGDDDYIVDDNEEMITSKAYRVKAVIHPLELASNAGDLILEYVCPGPDLLGALL